MLITAIASLGSFQDTPHRSEVLLGSAEGLNNGARCAPYCTRREAESAPAVQPEVLALSRATGGILDAQAHQAELHRDHHSPKPAPAFDWRQHLLLLPRSQPQPCTQLFYHHVPSMENDCMMLHTLSNTTWGADRLVN